MHDRLRKPEDYLIKVMNQTLMNIQLWENKVSKLTLVVKLTVFLCLFYNILVLFLYFINVCLLLLVCRSPVVCK